MRCGVPGGWEQGMWCGGCLGWGEVSGVVVWVEVGSTWVEGAWVGARLGVRGAWGWV